jgi:hypothetical protein
MILTAAMSASALGAGGCCQDPSAPGAPTSDATPMNDPELLDAAGKVTPLLEKSFADTYAGLELDHPHHKMIVYRRPDPALDAAVKHQAEGVTIEFRDAKFSLATMKSLVARILADKPYWEGQGVHIESVGPMVDGSSVRVGTREGTADQTRLLETRYGPGTVTIEKIGTITLD